MRVGFQLGQVLAMLFQAATLLPETRDSRTVLPAIEARQVVVDFNRAQGYPGPQSGIEAAVDFTSGLHGTLGMALAGTDQHLLWITAVA
ncbi:hypothetical protein D3C84_757000 [compost metagenome]